MRRILVTAPSALLVKRHNGAQRKRIRPHLRTSVRCMTGRASATVGKDVMLHYARSGGGRHVGVQNHL